MKREVFDKGKLWPFYQALLSTLDLLIATCILVKLSYKFWLVWICHTWFKVDLPLLFNFHVSIHKLAGKIVVALYSRHNKGNKHTHTQKKQGRIMNHQTISQEKIHPNYNILNPGASCPVSHVAIINGVDHMKYISKNSKILFSSKLIKSRTLRNL